MEIKPGQSGKVFFLDTVNPRQQYKRSLMAIGALGGVALHGVSSVELVVVFKYYAWENDKARPADWEESFSAIWTPGSREMALKTVIKAPRQPSGLKWPGESKGGYFLRVLFFRHWEFCDSMTLVDSLTSDVMTVATKVCTSMKNARYRKRSLGREDSFSTDRDSSPLRMSE
jgi:hypothetical protein